MHTYMHSYIHTYKHTAYTSKMTDVGIVYCNNNDMYDMHTCDMYIFKVQEKERFPLPV